MQFQRALIVKGRGQVAEDDHVPIPAVPPDYILVRTRAVAINPTDWKHVDFEPCVGTIVGCDYAGVVQAVGSQVHKAWNKGDRVAGFVHGCNAMRPQGGAFAQYVLAKGDLQFRVPDWMSMEEAACVGVGMITIGQNLYQSLQLTEPGIPNLEGRGNQDMSGETCSILIYGGATATGSVAIQFAKLSGLCVITTCSEHHQAWMHQLGADAVFDYHDPQVGDRIREETDDALELVFDTISTTQSAAVCAEAISSAGGCYNAVLDVRCPRSDVDTHVSMAYDIIGESYYLRAQEVLGQPKNLAFGVRWAGTVEALLQTRQIIPHPFHVKPGGLSKIADGLDLVRQGKVRGYKLVYTLEGSDSIMPQNV